MEILSRTTLFDFSYAERKNRTILGRNKKESAPKAKSRVASFNVTTTKGSVTHKRPRSKSRSKSPKKRSRITNVTTPTKSKDQSGRSRKPRDESESRSKSLKNRSRVTNATTPTKSKDQSDRSRKPRDESESRSKSPKKLSRVTNVNTRTKSKDQSGRSRKPRDESRSKSPKNRSRVTNATTPTKSKDQSGRSRKPRDESESRSKSPKNRSRVTNATTPTKFKDQSGRSRTLVDEERRKFPNPVISRRRSVRIEIPKELMELYSDESEYEPSAELYSDTKSDYESTSVNQNFSSPSKPLPAKKSKNVKQPLRREIKEPSTSVNPDLPSPSKPSPAKKSKNVKPRRRIIEESSTSESQDLPSPSKPSPAKKSKKVREPLRREIKEPSTSVNPDLPSPSKPSPAKKSKNVKPLRRIIEESSTSESHPSKPSPAKKSKNVKQTQRSEIKEPSTSANPDLPSTSKPSQAKKSKPVKKQLASKERKQFSKESETKKGGSEKPSSFKPITEIKLHQTRSRTRAINVINEKENVAPVEDILTDSNNSDLSIKLLIEGTRINEYKKLQNANKTGNKLSLTREQVDNSKVPQHFDTARIEGTENMLTEHPGVQMSHMFPIPTVSKHRLGFFSIEGRTVRPPIDHGNLMTMMWVLSGCVTVRTSAQIYNNHSLHHFKMGAGNCFVIPSWTLFTLENWETEPVKLGVCLFESG